MLKGTLREQLLAPISPDNPVGERLRDHPQLNFIDDQMMKVGTLSHGEVQWHEVESCAVSLLSEHTKDLKLLTVLMQCLQHQATPERFSLSIGVLVDFLSNFWLECQPFPGARGEIHRKKFFNQICQRTYVAADKLDWSLFDSDLKQVLEALLEELDNQASSLSLPVDIINDISARVRVNLGQAGRGNHENKIKAPQPSQDVAVSSSSIITSQTSTGAPVSIPNLDIDNSSERAFKNSLLKAVDSLNELGSDAIKLSIRVRRFAMWFSINTLPDANAQKETQLMPVSSDRISDYEESLQRGADIELWSRVEESLTKSPYWLDGHFLSFRIAKALGLDDWASIIKDELQSFVDRLPALLTYSFKGQVPFASEATIAWLLNQDKSVKVAQITQQGSWNEKRTEALQLADDEGIAPALSMLDEGLSQATEPRDAFYWRLLSADVMEAHSLSSMATVQYQTLYRQVNEMSVTEWEPSLLAQLKNNIAEQ